MRYNLRDTTFVIPFFYDSPERLENLNCILKFLTENFDADIIVSEVGETTKRREFFACEYFHIFENRDDGVFHRTQVINDGIKDATTKYVGIYDTDVVFLPELIYEAVELLREGAMLSYPHSGKLVDIKRSYINDGIVIEHDSSAVESVGGACFLNREGYIKCGMEQEGIVSWGPEDSLRYHIIKTLGHPIGRVKGTCWHIAHPPSSNSGVNKFTVENNLFYERIKKMSKEELLIHIKSLNT